MKEKKKKTFFWQTATFLNGVYSTVTCFAIPSLLRIRIYPQSTLDQTKLEAKKNLCSQFQKKKEVMAHIIDDDDVEDQNLEGFWGKQGGHAGTLN